MRWSDCAIQDLKKYEGLKASLENTPERIKALNDNFTSIKSVAYDKIPVQGGGGTKREDFLLDNIVERERLTLTLKANQRLAAVIEKGLKALSNNEYRVLELFFMHRQRDHIFKLCEELHLEQAQIYRIKNEALYKFTVNMYGIEEY